MHDSERKNPSLSFAMDRWAYDIALELIHEISCVLIYFKIKTKKFKFITILSPTVCTFIVWIWMFLSRSGSNGESVYSHQLDKPALVKLSLSLPPLKGSSASWEVLFKRLYKLIQLTEQWVEWFKLTSVIVMFHSQNVKILNFLYNIKS